MGNGHDQGKDWFDNICKNLSERRMEVLKLFSKGKDDATIAKELQIEEVTVRQHLSQINKYFVLLDYEAKRENYRARLMRLCNKYLE